ncbi:hypothetical protein [Ekhidna sp.]|uniref:hypothetical protein n=1 Tax=Ekhidna sp. TaxID=2608089 RepID=UPI003B50D297
MKKQFKYFLVAMFSIFLGSQLTEAVLLVPYWQSLSEADFYSYYQSFGPTIGRFYTILTITAAVIPIGLTVYLARSKAPGFRLAVTSAVLAVLFVACFYIYFNGTNELFYQSALSPTELKSELITWSQWHWGRVGLECFSLLFLILALAKRN